MGTPLSSRLLESGSIRTSRLLVPEQTSSSLLTQVVECRDGVTNSLELNRRRPAELVCFTPRKLTELLHRRVQSALCHKPTRAAQQVKSLSLTSLATVG